MYEVIYTNCVIYELNGASRWVLLVPHGLTSQHKGGGGRPIGPYNELKNLHFGNEEDMHMSSKIHEANGYGHDWELAIIL